MPSPAGCVCPGTKPLLWSVQRCCMTFSAMTGAEMYSAAICTGIPAYKRMHAFVHGHIAAERAKCVFGLSDEECEAIARHMFPLAAIPRTRIAWIVTLADKVVASREMAAAVGGYLSPSRRRALPEA